MFVFLAIALNSRPEPFILNLSPVFGNLYLYSLSVFQANVLLASTNIHQTDWVLYGQASRAISIR